MHALVRKVYAIPAAVRTTPHPDRAAFVSCALVLAGFLPIAQAAPAICNPTCAPLSVSMVIFNQETPQRYVANGQERPLWTLRYDLATGKIVPDSDTVFRDNFGD